MTSHRAYICFCLGLEPTGYDGDECCLENIGERAVIGKRIGYNVDALFVERYELRDALGGVEVRVSTAALLDQLRFTGLYILLEDFRKPGALDAGALP